MRTDEERITDLLEQKTQLEKSIKELNFKGYPEIKEINGKKYVYLRYKSYDRLSSKYAGIYTEDYFNSLKDLSKTVKRLNSELRFVKWALAKLGVEVDKISSNVLMNLDFARNNLETIIYGQAIVEGVSATFLDTEEILKKGSCKNVSFDDTLTILNLKNAWQYVLDEDTVTRGANFYTLSAIAGFVNDRQVSYPDSLRSTNVIIGGSSYRPEIPIKEKVVESLNQIIKSNTLSNIEKAIELVCFVSKSQLFNNGNKRTAIIFANLFLISCAEGFISIPSKLEREYKMLLVEYYEDKNEKVKEFLLNECFHSLQGE